MKKTKKLVRELERLALIKEILLTQKDIEEIQGGTYQQERKMGFDTSSCVGYCAPSDPEDDYEDGALNKNKNKTGKNKSN